MSFSAMSEKPLKKLERSGRKALRAALRAALPKPAPTADPDPSKVARVLVIRQDNRIGNLVLITPLLDGIRKAFPGSRVDVLTSDAFPEVFTGNTAVSKVIAAPKKAFIGHPIRFLAFFRELRRTGYDVAFDCSHMHEFSLSSAAAARLTAATVRAGYARGDADLYLTRLVAPRPDGTHEMDIHLDLLRAIAPAAELPAPGTLRPVWRVSAAERDAATARWARWGLDPAATVAIFLGGRGPKRWAPDRFRAIAESVRDGGRAAVVFAGPAEQETVESFRGMDRVRVAEPMGLREFAATIRACSAVVTSDTGPMHVAVAAGVPTVEIFTASEPERYGYGHLPEHRVVGRKGQEAGVDAVLSALGELLPARPRGAEA